MQKSVGLKGDVFMKHTFYCQWLDWRVDITCDYEPMRPFLEYYFQLYNVLKEGEIRQAVLHTEIEIKEDKECILVRCGHRSRNTSENCNVIMGVAAEFCNDDFLDQKRKEWCLLHGAAVSKDGETAHVFLAPTGTGKSTLAYYACIHGFQFCADDLAVLDMRTGCLLPYPKPIYLRNMDFLGAVEEAEMFPWYSYRLLFLDGSVKYPIFPEKCINKPLKPCAIHIYERGDLCKSKVLKMTESFRNLLINSALVSDFQYHSNQLIQLVRCYPVDWIQSKDLQELIKAIGEP